MLPGCLPMHRQSIKFSLSYIVKEFSEMGQYKL